MVPVEVRGNYWELVLHHVDLNNQTQVFWHAGKHFYQMSHLTTPIRNYRGGGDQVDF